MSIKLNNCCMCGKKPVKIDSWSHKNFIKCNTCDYHVYSKHDVLEVIKTWNEYNPIISSQCPFCESKGKALLVKRDDIWFHVECQNCGARGPIENSTKDAIEAFNNPKVKKKG